MPQLPVEWNFADRTTRVIAEKAAPFYAVCFHTYVDASLGTILSSLRGTSAS